MQQMFQWWINGGAMVGQWCCVLENFWRGRECAKGMLIANDNDYQLHEIIGKDNVLKKVKTPYCCLNVSPVWSDI